MLNTSWIMTVNHSIYIAFDLTLVLHACKGRRNYREECGDGVRPFPLPKYHVIITMLKCCIK